MYLSFDQKTITNFYDSSIEEMYANGFVMTRLGKGVMNQTRSLRINLDEFELSSENRRVLRKTEGLELTTQNLPIAENEYDWRIQKVGKDFYANKFNDVTFSANKIRELVTTDHNFNLLFNYKFQELPSNLDSKLSTITSVGYCISLQTQNILHYCYPFYDLTTEHNNLGMGMMLRAIQWAKEQGKKYIYIGSFTRPEDKYKLQFKGIECWDEKEWNISMI